MEVSLNHFFGPKMVIFDLRKRPKSADFFQATCFNDNALPPLTFVPDKGKGEITWKWLKK